MTMTGPRIAYLTSEYPTVSHTFILREIAALRARGLDVVTASVRTTPASQHKGPEEREEAARTFYLLPEAKNPIKLITAQLAALRRPGRYFGTLARAFSLSAPGLRAALMQIVYFLEATVLARHFAATGVTHVHNHFANPSSNVAMFAARLAGISFSFTLHGPSDLEEPRRTRLDAKIADAKFVSCISHYARSQAMFHSDPVHWPKLKIIHCGVMPDRYAEAGPPADEPRFIFVGRLAPVKGLRMLIEAFGKALEAEPGIRLTVVGDGQDRAWLEQAAKPFGDAIRITGALSQAEVAGELAAARAMVLPSFAEGVPVVLMEAMASGRPVIATRITGVPELVEDGVSGCLVPAGDVESLAGAMLRLARDPALAARMGQAGQEKVRSEFDIEQEAARVSSLFADTGGDAIRPSVA